MSPTFPTSPARIHGLDTLRALAIALVFMNHYTLFVSDSASFGLLGEIGWVGVDLFFGLSGYLIGNQLMPALRAHHSPSPSPSPSPLTLTLARFYARRLLRTLPNFHAVLALYYLWPDFRSGAELLPLWQYLTFTQNIALTPGTAFSHAWSLCVEEQFYLLFPASAALIAGRRRPLLLAWLAVFGMIGAGMLVRAHLWQQYAAGQSAHDYFKYIYYSSLCRVDELVAGVALALLKNYHAPAWARITACGKRTLAAGAGVTALAFWLFLAERYSAAATVFGYPLLALGFGLLIVSALSPSSPLRRTRVPGAETLALWSYAIYLTHKQVGVLLSPVLQGWGAQPDSWSAVIAIGSASLLAGWLLYRLVETPFMRLRERWVPIHPPLSARLLPVC